MGSVRGLGSGSIRLSFQKFQRPGEWPWGIKEGHWEEGPRHEALWAVTLQAGLLFPNIYCYEPVDFQADFILRLTQCHHPVFGK